MTVVRPVFGVGVAGYRVLIARELCNSRLYGLRGKPVESSRRIVEWVLHGVLEERHLVVHLHKVRVERIMWFESVSVERGFVERILINREFLKVNEVNSESKEQGISKHNILKS